MTYSEKLRDPRWQKRRLYILDRDKFTCQNCDSTDKTLMVHHTYYEKKKEPWEAKDENLVTLCSDCHEYYHESMERYRSLLVDSMKLKLKEPFITGCASDLFKDIENLNDIIYLLWELKDNESELIEVLTNLFKQKNADRIKKFNKCHV